MLKKYKVTVRTKLSLLWTTVTLLYLYGDYFELYTPHKVEGLITGDNLLDSPLSLFMASLLLAVPPLMVIGSAILNPALCKWMNISLGIFYSTLMLSIAITSFTAWYAFYVFYAFMESSLTILIIWYAFSWGKSKSPFVN